MRKPRVMVTPEMLAEMRRLRHEQVPVSEVAHRLGVARDTVSTLAPMRPGVLDSTEERILEALKRGERQTDIVHTMGVSQSAVSRVQRRAQAQGILDDPAAVAKDITSQNTASASLRRAILRVAVADGPFATTQVFMDACRGLVPQAYGTHEFVHDLYSLKKQNLLAFRQASTSSKDAGPTRITATPRGIAAVQALQVRSTDEAATSVTIEAIAAPEPSTALVEGSSGASPTGWRTLTPLYEALDRAEAILAYRPYLDSLRAGEAERDANKVKAARFLEAAAILADVDKEASDALLDRASALDGPTLSPTESEYLGFARDVDYLFTTLRDTIDSL